MKKTKMIESYLDGSKEKEEREKLEILLNKDKDLFAEVELHKDINEAISDDNVFDFRNIIITLFGKKDTRKLEKKAGFMKYLKYPVAAAIIVLIGFSLFQILTFKSPSEVYQIYYKPYQTDISTRSIINSTDKIQLSYILYQEGNYEASFEILSNYLEKNIDDQAAQFYYSMNAIELDKNELAIKELLLIEENTFSPFSLHARWYLAMVYLKLNQADKARIYLEILSLEDNMYSKKAKEILKKLRS